MTADETQDRQKQPAEVFYKKKKRKENSVFIQKTSFP